MTYENEDWDGYEQKKQRNYYKMRETDLKENGQGGGSDGGREEGAWEEKGWV